MIYSLGEYPGLSSASFGAETGEMARLNPLSIAVEPSWEIWYVSDGVVDTHLSLI